MLIFYKERLAFLSVPKTGTTAYETALRDRADMVISEPAMLKHAPVYRYNRFLRPMFFNVCDVELELLAVMREPISWLGSWWRYRQRPFMKGKPNATHNTILDKITGNPSIFDIVEPHKNRQGSITMINKHLSKIKKDTE